ncbi:MAG: MFS transporter [Clostridia bacterium]|nr:MFS transporter [Clostridia bacterium]
MATARDGSKDQRIILICWLAYFAAYIGRLNYNASIVSIIEALHTGKEQAGLVSSFFFFAYGAGQLVNGVLSHRYNSKYMVFFALTASAAINLSMPLCGSISVMKYLWLLNGAVQSILWTTLIKTISLRVSDAKIPRAIVVMSTPTAAGTFLAYGISALSDRLGSWRAPFFTATIVLLCTAVLWFVLYGKADAPQETLQVKAKSGPRISRAMLPVLALTAGAGIANGFIKDGVTTWVPSVLYESFGLDRSFSILLTLLLPLVSMLAAAMTKKVHDHIASLSAMNLLFYGGSTLLCGGILLFLHVKIMPAILLCFVCVACTMHMVNNVITSIFPLDHRALLDAGFAAGLLNTFCYVGSTSATYALGAVSERSGWQTVFLLVLSVSAVAVLLSFGGVFAEKYAKQAQPEERSDA